MNKRLVILVILLLSIASFFWLGSRYPTIDEKAAMAGQVQLEDPLSFEAIFPLQESFSTVERIFYSSINWMYTVKEGMIFGILFAAMILTLLGIISLRHSHSSFINAFKGTLIGAPLGVCVNCAAPIAKGMYQGGANVGTSLATMFSSPTLNVIVLTMSFSLFPIYMAVTKLTVTLVFILFILPLLVRFVFHTSVDINPDNISCAQKTSYQDESWLTALHYTGKDLLQNLWYIALKTIPLMLVAGIMGVTLATLLPLDALLDWTVTPLNLLIVGVIGTFLPVPIAFDIVAVQALLLAGLPPEFAMVLLTTLGLFSVLPFFVIWNTLSSRVAIVLFITVVLLGIVAGLFTQQYEQYSTTYIHTLFAEHFSEQRGTTKPDNQLNDSSTITIPDIQIPRIQKNDFFQQSNIRIERVTLKHRQPVTNPQFTQLSGSEIGLEYSQLSFLDYMLPFSQGRGITSADFNQDGWVDVALASHHGVLLYKNLGTNKFVSIQINHPVINQLDILLVAFIDINNDGWQDLFLGSFGETDYFLLNDQLEFQQPQILELPHQGALFTQSASFFDFDKDADLDFVKAHWFFLIPRAMPSNRATNFLVKNKLQSFEQVAMQDIVGETLTTLASDFNQDNQVDLVIGNDFMEPDSYFLGLSEGQFQQLVAGDIIPLSTLATMSIDSADYNNDLLLDLYLAGKTNDFSTRRNALRSQPDEEEQSLADMVKSKQQKFEENYCLNMELPFDQARCQSFLDMRRIIRKQKIELCLPIEDITLLDECIVTQYVIKSRGKRDPEFCEKIPDYFSAHKTFCQGYFEFMAISEKKPPGVYKYLDKAAIDQAMQGNLLLQGSSTEGFVDVTKNMGVYDGNWTWNAKFADLDNDEWQDLYLVNGWWLETRLYSNIFFHNNGGKNFTRDEKEFGLGSKLKVSSYTYLDIDNDGDLDIISVAMHGFTQIYINNEYKNNLINFEFRDKQGNSFGIGNKIYIYYGDDNARHQIREIKASSGFLSFDAPYAHFGLGTYDTVNKIKIIWSTGETTLIEEPFKANNKYIVFRE